MSDNLQIDELRDDIDRTRGDMTQTINQLQERLAPERLQRDTGEIVREVADQVIAELQGKTGELTQGLSEQIHAAVHGAATAKSEELLTQAAVGARTVGASLWDRVVQNPAPVALAAVAIGLLAAGERSGETGAGSTTSSSGAMGGIDEVLAQTNSVLERVTDAAGSAGERAGSAVERAKSALPHGAHPDGSTLPGLIGSQPIVAGFMALGVGLALGLTLPESDKERGLAAPLRAQTQQRLDGMGLASDPHGLVDQVKERAGGLAEQAKTAMSDGLSDAKQAASEMAKRAQVTAKDAASDHGLSH